MRIILGLLSGLLGMLAGWFGLAFLIIGLSAPDHEGGTAMGAFFNIGPIGGVAGFIAGVWLFSRIGVVTARAPIADAERTPDAERLTDAERPAAAPPAPTRISRPFAAAVLLLASGLAWWGWYELIRSPYLTHGFMTLDLQFRLPPGMALPPSSEDVQIAVTEGDEHADVIIGPGWHGHDGDRLVILATASLSNKTRERIVSLNLPGIAEQNWRLDLSYDPDPTPGYTAWREPSSVSTAKIEMNYRLSADH